MFAFNLMKKRERERQKKSSSELPCRQTYKMRKQKYNTVNKKARAERKYLSNDSRLNHSTFFEKTIHIYKNDVPRG